MNSTDDAPQPVWWQHGVVYQVYPRSFLDSNADGTGDLNGVTAKLDYLKWLGVDGVWLSPIFPSPMADFGYDVANYTDIEPLFGTLADFKTLLDAAHARGLKVLLDLVPNHTSDEHAWFVESRSSRDNPKRDWYIWRDPSADGGPPNNWDSHFGGSAWKFDEATGQYYLHLFDVKQPDLNWRNPAVREAVYAAMRFWFDMGVDGFRIDVIWMLIKDELFRDNPPDPNWRLGDNPGQRHIRVYTEDQPETHAIIRDMRALADSYKDRVLIGEIYLPPKRLVEYYGAALDEAHLPFNFQLILLQEWTAARLREVVDTYDSVIPQGAWPNWVLGNHDQTRVATRLGADKARLAHMLLLTLRGTPTAYYGDEIGMKNVPIPPELIRDPVGLFDPNHSRDPERTPMQWSPAANAGFSPPNVTPWLPVAADYAQVNVEIEQTDPLSMLALTRALLATRRANPALYAGDYRSVNVTNEACFVYTRTYGTQAFLITLNLSDQSQTVNLAQFGQAAIVVSTYCDRQETVDLGTLHLRANEGCLIQLPASATNTNLQKD